MCKRENLVYDKPKESNLLICFVDAVIAAQNAVIIAESLGIGSCYIGDIMEHYETYQDIFQLPKYVFPAAMVCFGYSIYRDKHEKISARFHKDLIYFKNTYTPWSKSRITEFDRNLNEMRKVPAAYSELKNIGQYIYKFKSGMDFSKEMIRSVKERLKNWI